MTRDWRKERHWFIYSIYFVRRKLVDLAMSAHVALQDATLQKDSLKEGSSSGKPNHLVDLFLHSTIIGLNHYYCIPTVLNVGIMIMNVGLNVGM